MLYEGETRSGELPIERIDQAVSDRRSGLNCAIQKMRMPSKTINPASSWPIMSKIASLTLSVVGRISIPLGDFKMRPFAWPPVILKTNIQ